MMGRDENKDRKSQVMVTNNTKQTPNLKHDIEKGVDSHTVLTGSKYIPAASSQ